MKLFYWFKWYKWLKMAFKMSQEFPTASSPWILPKIFIFCTVLTYTCLIPSSMQKHTTSSLTHHTHTWPSTTTNKKQLGTSHLLLMVISLAQKLLSCATFRPLRVIKKRRRYNFADWTGCGDARRLCSNEGMFQAFALVWQTAQNGRLHKTGGTYSVSELHVPHRQCLAGISNAFSASFTNICPSFPRFYCTPNKACLLCATPAGTYRVQSPGFPNIVYSPKESNALFSCKSGNIGGKYFLICVLNGEKAVIPYNERAISLKSTFLTQ